MILRKLTLITIVLASASCFALEGVEKDNIKLPFHNKIDDSTSDKEKLADQMKSLYGSETKKDEVITQVNEDEENMVSDFVDVEVHWGGKNKDVVDRRMNSVDEPVVYSN